MIDYHKIRHVHLEISSKCNAACPDCPRNFFGVNIVDNYPKCELRLEQIKKIFTGDFLRQLKSILICGNYGDFVTAKDALECVEYFFHENPDIQIDISTNASARPDIWSKLGRTSAQIQFRIDGLRDTHHLYRVNTDWDTVIANAQSFIASGGNAIWHMIVFDHNQHQIEQCRTLSQELGFRRFELTQQDPGVRNRMPVFDRDHKLRYVIGGYDSDTDFEYLKFHHFERDHWLDAEYSVPADNIQCKAIGNGQDHSIYIASNGEVYPCCWLGFYPQTNDTRLTNLQIRPMLSNINALEHGIQTAVNWFTKIEQSWQIPTVQQGRVDSCNSVCGKCSQS
jgi:MoaA/NifB/PqqE/SkfB family radical SAM enzyme